jgi:hypothetical protein
MFARVKRSFGVARYILLAKLKCIISGHPRWLVYGTKTEGDRTLLLTHCQRCDAARVVDMRSVVWNELL